MRAASTPRSDASSRERREGVDLALPAQRPRPPSAAAGLRAAAGGGRVAAEQAGVERRRRRRERRGPAEGSAAALGKGCRPRGWSCPPSGWAAARAPESAGAVATGGTKEGPPKPPPPPPPSPKPAAARRRRAGEEVEAGQVGRPRGRGGRLRRRVDAALDGRRRRCRRRWRRARRRRRSRWARRARPAAAYHVLLHLRLVALQLLLLCRFRSASSRPASRPRAAVPPHLELEHRAGDADLLLHRGERHLGHGAVHRDEVVVLAELVAVVVHVGRRERRM